MSKTLAERVSEMEVVVSDIKAIHDTNGIKATQKAGKLVTMGYLSAKYRETQDPVYYVACIRGFDLKEIENFISEHKKVEPEPTV